MKLNYISILFFSILFLSCNETKEDLLKKLNANKNSPSTSSVELRDNYENLKDKPVVFEGVVGSNCCGRRQVALIDLEDFIQNNGDNIHIALNFQKEQLNIIRNYSTGMSIKVVGFVGYKSKDVLWESNYNKGMETSINLKDCIILN